MQAPSELDRIVEGLRAPVVTSDVSGTICRLHRVSMLDRQNKLGETIVVGESLKEYAPYER
jgi:hypothetical protein